MSVEEERERWEEEQKRRAAEQRRKEQERKKQQERKRHNAYVTKRGITDVKLYNAVVCAFGEEEATKIKWQGDVVLPLKDHYGDIVTISGLKFFEYDSSICLLGDYQQWERLLIEPITKDAIFKAEKQLKKKEEIAHKAELERQEDEARLKVARENARQTEEARLEAEKNQPEETFLTALWNSLKDFLSSFF